MAGRTMTAIGRFFLPCSRGLLRAPLNHQRQIQAFYRAAVLKESGQPLVIQDVTSKKKLKNDEVRVEVHACGVNASDILVCQDASQKLPLTPGFEVCGLVLESGPKAEGVKVGDRIVGLNKSANGGFAEECIIPSRDVWVVSQNLKFDVGASLLDSYCTALLGLQRRAEIEEGDTVVVTAAAGGLGLAAVDLAANVYRAKVIGVCGTEDKACLVREKGAWASLKFKPSDLYRKVMDVTNNKGADIIFDAVGGEVFEESLKCVAHEGQVIVAGFASRQIPNVPTSLLLPQSFSLIGISLSHYRDAKPEVYRQIGEDVIELYEEHLISPHISAHFPLDQINEAFDFLLQRKSTGKVILTIR